MYRTHNCGELSQESIGKKITLCGWVHKLRNKGSIIWIDLRDRFGITQLVFEGGVSTPEIIEKVNTLGREYVISVSGTVKERQSKNPNIATGEIEIQVTDLQLLNASKTPPFTIEDDTDGGQELRMKYRYLDLRRPSMQENIILRHRVMQSVRNFLNENNFLEIETPMLVRSTPEGARDFVVPSRQHPGNFYALPQSPQLLKQLLMISGFDRYYQIVKCFRDEDLRADRQPEFTQIDCELSFVDQNDIMAIFERFIIKIFKEIKNIDLKSFPRITYAEAMNLYGSDKPDLRYDMSFVNLKELIKNSEFDLFKSAETVMGICVKNCAEYTRSQIDSLSDLFKKKNKDSKGLVYVKYISDDNIKSSVDKFFSREELLQWAKHMNASPGDLLLIASGDKKSLLPSLGDLRIHLAKELNLCEGKDHAPLWVTDFPLLEWDDETQRFYAMHHPFTMANEEDFSLFATDLSAVRAKAYDLVMNGLEIGGGSIRISCSKGQESQLEILGFDKEKAKKSFGFLLEALEYGAPPHGGIAFGLDRLCAVLCGQDSIRSFIAFPKNNSGKDVMLDAPNILDSSQLKELGLASL